MPVFYRADTRSPEEIFKYGFSSRSDLLKKYYPDNKESWRQFGVQHQLFQKNVSDANPYHESSA